MGALSALGGAGGLSASGGAAGPATSGDAKSGAVGGGISSPVVIGGFKSDGSASAFSIPPGAWYVIAGIAAFLAFKFVFKK
jgi:hypothetical protein